MEVFVGRHAELSWSVDGESDSRRLTGGGLNELVSARGTRRGTRNTPGAVTYTTLAASASRGGVTRSHSDDVTVTFVARPDVTSFSASPTEVFAGKNSTLSWVVTGTEDERWLTGPDLNVDVLSTRSRNVTQSSPRTATYKLKASATRGGVTEADSATVQVRFVAPPRVTLTARYDSVFTGRSSNLSWTVSGESDTRELSGGGLSAVSVIPVGSRSVSQATEGVNIYVVTASATRGGMTMTHSASATVAFVRGPTVILEVSHEDAFVGEYVRLTWEVEGVSHTRQLTGNGNPANVAVEGSLDVTRSRAGSRSYTVTASASVGDGPPLSDSETVTVEYVPEPVVSSLRALPDTIIATGGAARLYWSVRHADMLTIDQGVGDVSDRTSVEVRPSVNTTYTLTASRTAGDMTKTSQASVRIVISEPPVADLDWSCDGLTCRFDGTGSTDDGDSLVYTWSGATATDTAGIAKRMYGSRVTSSRVTLTVRDEQGQTDAATATVSASKYPVPRFTAGCGGLTCVFNAAGSTDDAGISSYSWDMGDGNTRSGSIVNYSYSRVDTFSVVLTVTDTHGNEASLPMDVVTGGEFRSPQSAPPTADFTTECNGLRCTFTSTSTGDSGIESYAWSTGDGAAGGTKAGHTHTYARAGTYTVTLVVRDAHGGVGGMARRIRLEEP